MTVIVTMEGALEPFALNEDFEGIVNTLNLTAMQGKQFAVGETTDGDNIIFNVMKVNTIAEVD